MSTAFTEEAKFAPFDPWMRECNWYDLVIDLAHIFQSHSCSIEWHDWEVDCQRVIFCYLRASLCISHPSACVHRLLTGFPSAPINPGTWKKPADIQQTRFSCEFSATYFEGILPKGPYLACVSMAGRALLAGYHRFVSIVDGPPSLCTDDSAHTVSDWSCALV